MKILGIRFHRPRRIRRFLAAMAVLALGLAAAATGFAHPATRSTLVAAFSNTGEFSYTGQTTHADPLVYPDGKAETGEELVLSDIDQVNMQFTYHFHSKLQHQIRGTILLEDVFIGDSGWRNGYKLGTPIPFVGDQGTANATVSLSELEAILARLQAGSDVAARSFAVHLVPVVRYEGVVDGKTVHGTFSPSLPFMLDAAVFVPQALNLNSASTQQQTLAAELHPSLVGKLPHTKQNVISVVMVKGPAVAFRLGGIFVALVGLLVALRSQRRRRDDIWSHEKRVAHRFGRAIIDVIDLEENLPPGSILTAVANFEGLAAMAAQTERAILREIREGEELFGVDQPPRLYVYRKPPTPEVAPALEHETAASPAPAAGAPSRRRVILRRGAGPSPHIS
ncbi:MAG TPA: hypothetical protein VGM80_14960 [Gaiellaceae bacterium]